MNKENQEKLYKKYPKLFAGVHKTVMESCMSFGCECGNGWYNIIEELCEKIKDYEGVEFLQVKEKFAELRVYVNEVPQAVHDAIEEASDKSVKTCELCGEPGKVRSGGWMVALCDKCSLVRDEMIEERKSKLLVNVKLREENDNK